MNITQIREGYNTLTFTLTERLTNAVDTYNLMLKLNTEQETGGEYDTLNGILHDVVEPHDLSVTLQPQFFKGNEDMIFEMLVHIQMSTTCKLDNKDLVREYILGTVLSEIQKHFGFYYRHHSSDIEVVKHYFRNY